MASTLAVQLPSAIKEVEGPQSFGGGRRFFRVHERLAGGICLRGAAGRLLSDHEEVMLCQESCQRGITMFDGNDSGSAAIADCARRLAKLVQYIVGRAVDYWMASRRTSCRLRQRPLRSQILGARFFRL
jgi:hypothetical protein